MSTVISIQARMGSTRLPGKVLLPIGQRRSIGWVCKRCISSEVGEVWITTGMTDANKAIVTWCERSNVRYVRGPESNLLERHLLVAEQSGADTIVRINADCPFVPSTEIQRVHTIHQDNNEHYTTNHTGTVPHGINVDVLSVEILQQLQSNSYTHPVTPLREKSYTKRFTESTEWTEYEEVKLTLDTPQDYWKFVDVVGAVGGNPQNVAQQIDRRSSYV